MNLFLAATAGAQPRWGTRGLGEEHLQSDYSGEEGEDARAFSHGLPVIGWCCLEDITRTLPCLSCAQAGRAQQVLAVADLATIALEVGTWRGAVRAPTVAAAVQQAQFVWDTPSLCLLAGNNPKHPSVTPKDVLLWVIYVAILGSSSCKAESLCARPPSGPPLSSVMAFLIGPGEAVQAGTLLHSRTLPEPSPGSRPTAPPWHMVIGHPPPGS